jgi:hypothetical protein
MTSKAVISLTTGLEDPEMVTVAFLVAVGAAEAGRPTLMFQAKEAVRLRVHPDRRRDLRSRPGIGRGKIRKRKKAASQRFRGAYGHTPLSAAEDIPWRCRRLVIGTGADGALPRRQQVREEARPARSTSSSCP